MIKSFRHKGLAAYFLKADSRKIRPDLRQRIQQRLRMLHRAEQLGELNIPGFDFHGLEGRPKRYSIHVNGPFCITFEWRNGEAWCVDLEQYH
jgi:proteic killer suppression protein